MAMNLKASGARETILKLVAECDVLVEIFVPASLRSCGLRPQCCGKCVPFSSLRRSPDSHAVTPARGENWLLNIDRHLVNEVTSPQAFRRAAHGGTQGAAARRDDRSGRSQCADIRPRHADRRIAEPGAG